MIILESLDRLFFNADSGADPAGEGGNDKGSPSKGSVDAHGEPGADTSGSESDDSWEAKYNKMKSDLVAERETAAEIIESRNKLKARIKELESGQTKTKTPGSKSDADTVARADAEAREAALQSQLDERDKLIRDLTVRQAVDRLTDGRVPSDMRNDFYLVHGDKFDTNEAGKLIVKGTTMSPENYIASIIEKQPSWGVTSVASGAGVPKKGEGAGGDGLPSDFWSWPESKQAEYLNDKPELRKRIMREGRLA